MCRQKIRASLSPRARAVVTKGDSMAVSSDSRMTCPRNPASGIAMVSAGSTMPSGPGTLTGGRIPRVRLKNRIRTVASQKCGTAAATSSSPEPMAQATRPPRTLQAARRARERPREGERAEREGERRAELFTDRRRHGLVQRVRLPEVAGHEPPEVGQVLHHERPVEAVLAADLLQRLGTGLRAGPAEDRLGGVAGDQPERRRT